MVTAAITFDEWLAANPLRAWRRKTKTTLYGATARAGVTLSALQKWEAGIARPIPENMARLAEVTGRKRLSSEWTRWLKGRPE